MPNLDACLMIWKTNYFH